MNKMLLKYNQDGVVSMVCHFYPQYLIPKRWLHYNYCNLTSESLQTQPWDTYLSIKTMVILQFSTLIFYPKWNTIVTPDLALADY